MFCEKTTTLIAEARKASYAAKKVLLIEHNDTRYTKDAIVATHSELRQGSTAGDTTASAIRVVKIGKLLSEVGPVDENFIGINEGQFKDDLVKLCVQWASEGREVVVAALNGTSSLEPWPQISALIPHCDGGIDMLEGVCMVCRDRGSAFSQKIVPSTGTVQYGAKDAYRAVCRWCFAEGERRGV
jgi:thymidine kinase